jgi:hypothetical protein
MSTMNVHVEDLPLFVEITTAMRRVAKMYQLPLKDIFHNPNPEGPTEYLGRCHHDGRIELIFRWKQNGKWMADRRRDEDIWGTAAHELAHLRHFNHGVEFYEFEQEMLAAMQNRKEDHRSKVIDKLVKMQRQRDSEAKIGNADAAEAFAAAINRMMLQHELNPTDLDYARADAEDPVIEVPVDFDLYNIERKKTRVAWQESLARIIAEAHLCSFLISPNSNRIYFVGTKSHATVAEYVFGTLVPIVERLSDKEAYYYRLKCNREGRPKDARGYRPSWLQAFVDRIRERMKEERQKVVQESVEMGAFANTETAMIRLNGTLIKVRKYIDDKFSHRRKKMYAAEIRGGYGNNSAGRDAGRAAADRMNIGRKGISSGVKGLLK